MNRTLQKIIWADFSDRESGEGYSDILVEIEEETGIAIEVRYARDGNLGKGCREALVQTEQQRYEQQQSDDGMRTVLKYGVL